jgi:nitrogen fixation NifU-like protein
MQKYDGYSNKFKGSCGDSMWVWIKVNNDIIQEASYISDVCIGSITCGSILTEMIKGKSIGSALRISQDDILKELGGFLDFFLRIKAIISSI